MHLFKKMFNFFIGKYFLALFISSLFFNKKKKIVVIDIDNTIADTWKSLKNKSYSSNNKRLRVLSPLVGTINYLQTTFPKREFKWVFITHRPFISYFVTFCWFKNANLPVSVSNLFLVSSPYEKLKYIKKIKGLSINYFDDLSYNHENDIVKYYNEVIDLVMDLPVNYYNYEFILKLNEKV
jgi:hypothetical protein